jgi:hypothetical protein
MERAGKPRHGRSSLRGQQMSFAGANESVGRRQNQETPLGLSQWVFNFLCAYSRDDRVTTAEFLIWRHWGCHQSALSLRSMAISD